MTTEDWNSFADTLTQQLSLHKTPINSTTDESIETTWHKIQCSIIYAATHTIPNKISRKRSYNHQYSPHSTLLHLSLKKLGHIIKLVKKLTQSSNISNINRNISQINKQSQCDLQLLTSVNPSCIQLWLQHAHSTWKQLYHARHLENSLLLRQQINKATDKRCVTLTTHPTQAINSILNRYHQPVHLSNIKLPNQLITDPSLIKQHVQSHFHNWTALKPINETLFNNLWKQQYLPLPHINPNWYHSLNSPITNEELLQTLSQLPNNKACGPTGISYEMLKHISPQCTFAITALFN
jgi:hypothetical protein